MSLPIIRDPQHEFSGRCKRPGGLKDLDRIHRTLPPFILENNDPEVLQDEDGNPILDETTGSFIYDTFRNGGGTFQN